MDFFLSRAKNFYLRKIKYLVWKIIRKNCILNLYPKNIILILASPRSGSTWFSDAIRCFPLVQYWPTGIVYANLGLYGRRYPIDLSEGADGKQKVEVLPFKWEKIPEFKNQRNQKNHFNENILIEKCHPEFYNFKTEAFLNKIEHLEKKGVNIDIIYQVREPKACISSFLSYQGRNPGWYSSYKENEIIKYMDNTFSSMYKLAKLKPGIVVDFSDITDDLASVLHMVYAQIFSKFNSKNDKYIQEIIKFAITATARNKREKTSFLGEEVGPVEGGYDKHMHLFEKYKNDVMKCCHNYYSLLKIREDRKH